MRLAPFIMAVSLLPGFLPAQETALERAARAGHRAYINRAYTTAVYYFKDVVIAEPKHPFAWHELCRAYLELDQLDAAIDACRKHLAAHPQAPETYTWLAKALWKNGQRDQAIDAFRRQIAVDPRMFLSYGDLAKAYCDVGKYAEALAALDKSREMNPNFGVDQISLGAAHLGLGHIDQGLEILTQQRQSSTPQLNRIADILVSHRVALDVAQQYAESAVAGTAAELQRRTEQPIIPDTLQLVVTLSDYWDTLAKVYREQGHADREGQFTAAVRQLRAAGTQPIPAGKLLAEKAAADFYVVQSRNPPLAAAQFIRGDDRLRPFTKAVQDAVPPGLFPQPGPSHLPRRVNLICPGQGRDCTIELLSASAALYAELNAVPVDTRFASDPPPKRSESGPRGPHINPPVPTYRIEPEYSEEARKNGLEGVVILQADVDSTGHPRNIKVVRPLGMGLDEKAIEAVNQWVFRPGMKDGEPVTVRVTVEVNFRLLKRPPVH